MWKFLQIQLQHLLLQASRSSYDILAISNKPCPLFCAVSFIFPCPSQGLFWMPVLQEKTSSVQLSDKQKLEPRSCKDTPLRLCDSQSLSPRLEKAHGGCILGVQICHCFKDCIQQGLKHSWTGSDICVSVSEWVTLGSRFSFHNHAYFINSASLDWHLDSKSTGVWTHYDTFFGPI